MRITVQVKPFASKDHIEKIDDTHIVVAVTQPPLQGKANRAIIKLLAMHFGLKPYQITLVSGHASRTKIFIIPI